MAQVKKFENGISVSVILLGKARRILDITDNNTLIIPKETIPNAFSLILHADEKARVVFAQKNVGEDKGRYNVSFDEIGIIGRQIFSPPIQVIRPGGGKVWTGWHKENPNRMDCWLLLNRNGSLGLFQIGVITHDCGKTFRLLGEWRWRGTLFRQPNGKLVGKPGKPDGKPEQPIWGPLSPQGTRDGIFLHEEMIELISQSEIKDWTGSPEELEPPLNPVPKGNFGRVDWYIPFAGQNGQGIVKLSDSTNAWVHGEQIIDPPDSDGIKRLWRNNLIEYQDVVTGWGSKSGPPKLIKVRRVPTTK